MKQNFFVFVTQKVNKYWKLALKTSMKNHIGKKYLGTQNTVYFFPKTPFVS